MPEREIRCNCGNIHIITISIEFEHVFGMTVGMDIGPTTVTRTLGYICPKDSKTKQVPLEFDESATEKIKYVGITKVRNKK